MYLYILIIFSFTALLANAYAQVYIPDDEYKGYFNSDGLYTVVGVIKSSENKPVKPIIYLEIDDGEIIKKRIEWSPILNPSSLANEIPFKIIIPEVKSANPVIKSIDVRFEEIDREPISVMAMYDDTLKIDDDHVTGRVINLGKKPVNDVRIYAVAHDYNGDMLDVGISLETLDLKPNEIKEFNMYIDPKFAGKVAYYSCFAPSDPLVINLTTTRYGEQFEVYAEGPLWFYNPRFDETNNILYINATNNSFLFSAPTSLRVQLSSPDEKLQVYMDNKPIDTFQSMEQDGMSWHISFDYPARSFIKDIRIVGFEEPQYKYIKFDANNTIVTAQLPREIIPMEESSIKLAFYNKTDNTLIKDQNYSIKLFKDDLILELNRTAINGIDTINYTFEDEGVIDMEINIPEEDLTTQLVVVPEFPVSILIITVSMMLVIIMRYNPLRH